MKPCPVLRRVAVRAAVLAALLLPAALPWPSDASASDAMEARQKEMESKRKEWVQKYEELLARHASLQAQLEQARTDYSRGRSTRDLVGSGKAALVAELDRLEKEFAEVDAELKDFPDQARRAGALPGWFRDPSPASPSTAAPAAGAEDEDDSASPDSLSERRARKRDSRRLP